MTVFWACRRFVTCHCMKCRSEKVKRYLDFQVASQLELLAKSIFFVFAKTFCQYAIWFCSVAFGMISRFLEACKRKK